MTVNENHMIDIFHLALFNRSNELDIHTYKPIFGGFVCFVMKLMKNRNSSIDIASRIGI